MWNPFKKKVIRDYQSELEWKYPDRPVVMSWTRWAIPRSNLQTSLLFIGLLMPPLITAAVCYVGLTKGNVPGFYWKEFLLSLIATVILFPPMCGIIFEHRFYVYRLKKYN